MNFLYFLLIGALAGWLGGKIMNGTGFGLLADILIGIAGGFIGGWLFGILGIRMGNGFIGSLVTSLIGAIVLIYVVKLIRGRG